MLISPRATATALATLPAPPQIPAAWTDAPLATVRYRSNRSGDLLPAVNVFAADCIAGRTQFVPLAGVTGAEDAIRAARLVGKDALQRVFKKGGKPIVAFPALAVLQHPTDGSWYASTLALVPRYQANGMVFSADRARFAWPEIAAALNPDVRAIVGEGDSDAIVLPADQRARA